MEKKIFLTFLLPVFSQQSSVKIKKKLVFYAAPAALDMVSVAYKAWQK